MPITKTPKVQLKIDPGGEYRVMFANPNEGLSETDQDVVNTLRVFHRTYPEDQYQEIVDLDLPFSDSGDPIELFFYPPRPGSFQFSWARVDAQAIPTPIEEVGPRSFDAPFVYGRLSTLKSMIDGQACGSWEINTDKLMRLNFNASKEFECATGWHFYPKFIRLPVDGNESSDLELPFPIIEVLQLLFRDTCSRSLKDHIVAAGEYVVYNRHIQARNMFNPSKKPNTPDGYLEFPGDGSGGMTGGREDDRYNPLISFKWANEDSQGSSFARSGNIFAPSTRAFDHVDYGFSHGRQNLIVLGFFGYTESDLSTPFGACYASERLALRQAIMEFGDQDDIERVLNFHKITMEKTDTHMVQYKQIDPLLGSYTGDYEIDKHIAGLSRGAIGLSS